MQAARRPFADSSTPKSLIVSHRHRFVFIEVPHTGSHSIAKQLIAHYGGKQILRHHANVTQFLAQASKDEKRYFKLATVRNPLDSATTDYCKLRDNHRGQYTNPAQRLENGGQVTSEHLREYRFIRDQQADFPTFFATFRNRLYNNWFLVGDYYFDHVIRFENLQEGFSEFLKLVGVEQIEPVGHVNPTKGKKASFESFYTHEIRRQAASCYGPFMRKWGYDFPDGWDGVHSPWFRELQFKILDRCVGLAARFVTLDPDNRVLAKAKKIADRMTAQRGATERTR